MHCHDRHVKITTNELPKHALTKSTLWIFASTKVLFFAGKRMEEMQMVNDKRFIASIV